MNEILCEQLALDYCCTAAEVCDGENHFTKHRLLEGRRRWRERGPCYLKIAAVKGKLLVSGQPDIVAWCKERYSGCGSEWFFEPETLRELDARLHKDGWQIESAHPFYLAERPSEVKTEDWEIRRYEGAEIERFRGDGRYGEAYAFCPEAPDVLGAAAVREGRILGMAGASCDSPTMWQIGINVEPEARGAGVGTMLVALLKNEILSRGVLPFYGTSASHLASQRVALGAGFVPAWAELITSPVDG